MSKQTAQEFEAQLLGESQMVYNNANILITGGTGSFGKAFLKRLLTEYRPKKVVVFSRDELKQSEMISMFPPDKYPQVRFFLGDVRDRDRLMEAFRGIDIVIHAAALKQVPALEYNPQEAIKTNVNGALNIIHAALERKVKYVCALSTDKAATPINLYGATKLCSDKLFVAGNQLGGENATKFIVVRYGNVFGSRGSIVPVFHKMKKSGTVTITEKAMTRFTITLHEAVNFVLTCLPLCEGGEVYVPKIPSYRIDVIAKAIAPECEHVIIGRRPGEKLHEVMVPEDDSYRTVELVDRYSIEPEWGGEKIKSGTRTGRVYALGCPVSLDFCYDSGANAQWVTVGHLRRIYKEWALEVLDEEIQVATEGDEDGAEQGRESSMGAIELLKIKVKAEAVADFKEQSRDMSYSSSKEGGCMRFDMLQSPDDETSFTFYQVYRTEGDLKSHAEEKHFKEWWSKFEGAIEATEKTNMSGVFP